MCTFRLKWQDEFDKPTRVSVIWRAMDGDDVKLWRYCYMYRCDGYSLMRKGIRSRNRIVFNVKGVTPKGNVEKTLKRA